MDIEFTWNSGFLFGVQNAPRAVFRALKKAGNRALLKMRTEAKRAVREHSRIRAQYLQNKSFPLDYPRGNSIDGLVWRMRVSGRGVPLGQFPVRQVKAGVRVEVLKGAPKVIRSAFLADAPKGGAGKPGVFLRPGKERYPMGHRQGPRVSDMLDNDAILQTVKVRTASVMRAEFERLLPLELAR